MGIGSAPSHAWTISHEQLASLVPVAWANLSHELNRYGTSLDALARSRADEEPASESEDAREAIDRALEQLFQEFKVATQVGESCLELELFHYSADEGSRYDDLNDGANWLVDGVQQLTPAGAKFRDRIEWKGWTTFC